MILLLDTQRKSDELTQCIGAVFYDASDSRPEMLFSSEVKSACTDDTACSVAAAIKLIKNFNLKPDVILINGLVHQADKTDDFGMLLYHSLQELYGKAKQALKIIGIKTDKEVITEKRFSAAHKAYRNSIYPVIVTTNTYDIGISSARLFVKELHGDNRIPSILSFVREQLEHSETVIPSKIAA